MEKKKVYYRIGEIATKFGVGQKIMAEILRRNGINEVLEGIYDRDSFRGKVTNLKKMVEEYISEKRRSRIKAENPDGYMNINEIASVFGLDVSCVRRKINALKLPYITGIRGEKRYHDVVIDRYSHILKKGRKLPAGKNKELRSRGYIPYSEFEILAGITRATLIRRIHDGLYTDYIMSGNVAYIHKRNLNVQPVKNSHISSKSPDGYIPLVTIRNILNLKVLTIQQYINRGIVNPLCVVKKTGFVYIQREEAEKFIEWYLENRRKNENKRNGGLYTNAEIHKNIGILLSDYKFND